MTPRTLNQLPLQDPEISGRATHRRPPLTSRGVVGRAVCAGLLVLAAVLTVPQTAAGQTRGRNKKGAVAASKVDVFKSKNFIVHTDIGAERADELLKKLETMLVLISRYWGRPLSGVIEMYVVEDVANWPAGVLDPDGQASIEAGGGLTMSQSLSDGNSFISKSIVYATADRGTPQHEAVHAYCFHTFGRAGPVWYAEGMAEMGQYWQENDSAVNCHEVVVEYIRNSEPKELGEIVSPRQQSGDSWQNYAWRWALCHLLANNTNYAPRFRPLGMGLLTQKEMSFESVYGSQAKEISFEYLFFLKHFDRGYRVDLCSWDWKTRFQTLRTAASVTSKVDARRGWQPSKLTVLADTEYEYSITGKWSTSTSASPVTADGAADGQGKLVGIIFDDYKLSEPFELGTYGTFTPPQAGDLFLRCSDQWNEIADNSGKLSARLKIKGKGLPLPQPKNDTKADADEPVTKSAKAKKSKNAKPAPGGGKPQPEVSPVPAGEDQ